RGLSGARNLGIAAALEAWPQAEALYMLDADNRLAPGALAAGRRVLAADPEIAFVYPQLVKFGIPWSGHVAVEA
ncbi:glycosyltransferase family A protein, partial [Raoultella ornithinolytica]